MRALPLAVLALGSMGCASGFRLGQGPALPYEARVWLLDAEEDLMTARARTEETRVELVRADKDLATADARLARLTDGEVQVDSTVEAMSLLKEEARAQIALAKATRAWREKAVDLAERSEGCADVRYAAARAEAEVRYRVEGANERQVGSLTARADSCVEKLKKHQDKLAELEEARDSARAALERTAAQAALKAPLLRPRPFLE